MMYNPTKTFCHRTNPLDKNLKIEKQKIRKQMNFVDEKNTNVEREDNETSAH